MANLQHSAISNAASTLCQACRGIFGGKDKPLALTVGDLALVAPPGSHHQTVQSFQSSVASGCFICSIVKADFPKEVGSDSEPATISRIYKVPTGYQILIIVLAKNRRTAIYLNTAEFNRTPTTNVPNYLQDSLVHGWISNCCGDAERHALCHRRRVVSQKIKHRPKLLLHVREENNMTMFQILDITTNQLHIPYATISQHPEVEETVPGSKIEENSFSHSVEVLTRGLQDAIHIALAAGLSHVWVSSLCSSSADSHRHRGDVYASAVFNIAMLDSTPQTSRPLFPASKQCQVPIVNPGWSPKDCLMVYSQESFSDLVRSSNLWTSASFHQDFLLAPATIFCCEQQLWFQCLEGTVHSSWLPTGPSDGLVSPLCLTRPHGLDPKSLDFAVAADKFDTRLAAFWTAVVAELSAAVANNIVARTEITDVIATKTKELEAPSAPEFHLVSCAHGVWSRMITYQLAWNSKQTSSRSLMCTPKAAFECLPSWSWLSVPGAVEFNFLTSTPGLQTTNIWEDIAPPLATVTFAEPETPECLPSKLLVHGRLFRAIPEFPYTSQNNHQYCPTVVDSIGKAYVMWDRIEEFQKATDTGRRNFYVVWPIFVVIDKPSSTLEAKGLLLRQTTTKDAYVRCGSFSYDQLSDGPVASEALEEMVRGDKKAFDHFVIQ
ncbi:hypothetical protein BKA67DRAFT_658736 [Truncatella angustata]|uniref:Heterokaryon incompatibility domain-containing protein n=1 Tax=Truncatella angustata TaxID=152316 RepID=A0A9P8ULT9_9PEZI|nr:uncharacterized protein BKA67DRAFT_658736 [Truncatella angustata]KAH6654436.1 hypothetical protein BKA67DRAFT_658736 [Truncatella angustata]